MRFTKSIARAIVASEVWWPRMTSTNGIRSTGEKKCKPTKFAGRCDARAHHAGTEDADLAISLHRNRAGSPDQLIGVADRVEQRADHVLGLRRNRQTRELPVLYLQPGIDVDMASVIDAFHNRRGRR